MTADTGPTAYTVRSSPNGAGRKVTLRGLSIRRLLVLGGFDPDRVQEITVPRGDGSVARFSRADFAGYPEGPALVADDPGATRFLRPLRGPGSTNARDYIVASAVPLEVNVNGGDLLPVQASARPRRTSTGRTVSFSAHVRSPPGATLTYSWDFDDGTHGFGASATHRFTREGEFPARVIVRGSGSSSPSCPHSCGGADTASVSGGTARTRARPGVTPGAGGSSGAQGGAGNGSGGASGTAPGGRGSRRGPRKAGAGGNSQPRPRAVSGEPVTGVLLADSPSAAASSLSALRPAGARTARTAGAGSNGGARLGGSIALTLMLIALGAVHERRAARQVAPRV